MSWARLLKRAFDIDLERCPNGGGALKIIAAIEDPPVIVKILTGLAHPSPVALSGAAAGSIPSGLIPRPDSTGFTPEPTSPLGLRSRERPYGVDLSRLRSTLGPKNPRKSVDSHPRLVRLTPITPYCSGNTVLLDNKWASVFPIPSGMDSNSTHGSKVRPMRPSPWHSPTIRSARKSAICWIYWWNRRRQQRAR